MLSISEIKTSFTIEPVTVDNQVVNRKLAPKRTEEQVVAIEIAQYFKESIGFWIGMVRRAKIRPWFIRAKFDELKKQAELDDKARAKILMFFIRSHNRK